MAIVQSSLAEEILSRQERAVIRGIYRASQLAEALNALDKATQFTTKSCGAAESGDPSVNSHCDTNVANIRAYLVLAIENALVTTNVPGTVSVKKGNPSKQT